MIINHCGGSPENTGISSLSAAHSVNTSIQLQLSPWFVLKNMRKNLLLKQSFFFFYLKYEELLKQEQESSPKGPNRRPNLKQITAIHFLYPRPPALRVQGVCWTLTQLS